VTPLLLREGCLHVGQASEVHSGVSEQAARLVIETGRPVAHVAAEIGVGEVLGMSCPRVTDRDNRGRDNATTSLAADQTSLGIGIRPRRESSTSASHRCCRVEFNTPYGLQDRAK
jgi:hypothetical protein